MDINRATDNYTPMSGSFRLDQFCVVIIVS